MNLRTFKFIVAGAFLVGAFQNCAPGAPIGSFANAPSLNQSGGLGSKTPPTSPSDINYAFDQGQIGTPFIPDFPTDIEPDMPIDIPSDECGRIPLIGGINLEDQRILEAAKEFNEREYLQMYPDVAEAVKAGHFSSGLDHYKMYGIREQRNPSLLFNESLYLSFHQDVAAAVKRGDLRGGFEHYMLWGHKESRYIIPVFDEFRYLDENPDVELAVKKCELESGLLHYVLFGRKEGRPAHPVSIFLAQAQKQ